MRILVIGINYAPEKISVGPFTTGLCEHLAARGHQLTVVTAFPHYPEWRVWDGYRGSLHHSEIINGVKVHRVAHYVPTRASSLVQRLGYDLSFALGSLIVGLFTGAADIIYCSCPPPTVAFTAYLLGKLKRAPYAIKLTDLASDAALATGIMKPGFAITLARIFEGFIYRRALTVICLCRGFINRLTSRRIDENKLRLIPDWGDTANIVPSEPDPAFRLANQLPEEKFLIFHTGNMGKKQYLINVLNSADLSRQETGLQWVLVGQGEERRKLEQDISGRNLNNVRMLPLQPAEALSRMYSSADVLLLNQSRSIEDAVIPSKLLTYMAAGRPIVAAVSERSEAARQILRGNCGIVVQPENPQALVDAVLALRQDPALRRRLGLNGRAYVEGHFMKDQVLRAYDEFFRSVDPEVSSLSLATRQEGS